ncbi:MAG: hypothetical protein R3Y68_08560 [Rikenellaceae bacterium]
MSTIDITDLTPKDAPDGAEVIAVFDRGEAEPRRVTAQQIADLANDYTDSKIGDIDALLDVFNGEVQDTVLTIDSVTLNGWTQSMYNGDIIGFVNGELAYTATQEVDAPIDQTLTIEFTLSETATISPRWYASEETLYYDSLLSH